MGCVGFEPTTKEFRFVWVSSLPGLFHHPQLYLFGRWALFEWLLVDSSHSSLCTFPPTNLAIHHSADLAQDCHSFRLRFPWVHPVFCYGFHHKVTIKMSSLLYPWANIPHKTIQVDTTSRIIITLSYFLPLSQIYRLRMSRNVRNSHGRFGVNDVVIRSNSSYPLFS